MELLELVSTCLLPRFSRSGTNVSGWGNGGAGEFHPEYSPVLIMGTAIPLDR